jgi:chromosome segregation ATPase
MSAAEKLNAAIANAIATYRKTVTAAASGVEVDPGDMLQIALNAGRTPAQLADDLELCCQRVESHAAFEAPLPGKTSDELNAEYKAMNAELGKLEADYAALNQKLRDHREAMRHNRHVLQARERQAQELSKEYNQLMRSTAQPGTDCHEIENFLFS